MKFFEIACIVFVVLLSCSPTKKLLKEHKYSGLIAEATAKLAVNPKDKKALQTLQQVYREAMFYFQVELEKINAGNDSFKWNKTLEIMLKSNDLVNKIRSNETASKAIADLKVYSTALAETKPKAIEELLSKGKSLLKENTKEKSREAYYLFKKAFALSTDIKDINLLINNAQVAATYNVVIEPVRIDFNTLNVATKKVDKALFYWTQRDVTSRPFVRYITASDADKLDVDPDFYVQVNILDYRAEKIPTVQNANGASNLMATGNLQIRIYSSSDQTLVFKKHLSCRYDSETKSTISVNTIDLQRVVDPDIQTFFDNMMLSGFEKITEEIDNYFNTLVVQ